MSVHAHPRIDRRNLPLRSRSVRLTSNSRRSNISFTVAGILDYIIADATRNASQIYVLALRQVAWRNREACLAAIEIAIEIGTAVAVWWAGTRLDTVVIAL